MATLLPNGKQSFITSAGIPLVGGKVYTYDSGTSTPRITWSDAQQTVPNTNPVILDSRGEASIFWSGSYKVQLQDALGNVIWTQDNIANISPANSALDNYSIDSGSANAYVANGATSINGYLAGLRVALKIANANTGASTLNYMGFGVRPIINPDGTPLSSGQLSANGIYAFEFDGASFQIMGNAISAANALSAAEIAAGIVPTNYSYPPGYVDRYGTNAAPGTTDMTAAINAAIAVMSHQAQGGNAQFLASTYSYSGTLNLLSNVILKGAGKYQTILNWVPTSGTNAIYAGSISNFGVEDLTLNGPGILSSTYCSGIYMDTGSSDGVVTRCFVTGFPQMPPFSPSTHGYAIDMQGTNLEVSYCRVEDSTYCIVVGGFGPKVLYNYINQHYSTKGVIPWGTGSASQFWGGIDVGAFDFLIHGNYIIDCGAGNIFVGGNGGISQNGRITENFSAYSWDRCLDNGVVSTVAAGDNVIGIVIADNVLYNGRNNNLWLAGTSNSTATGNVCIYDANYATWAGGAFITYPGTRISIGLFDGGAGAALTNLSLVGNTSIDTVNPGISFSYGTNPPVGCTISGNVSPSGYFIFPGAHITNSIDAEVVVPLTGSLLPTATGWTGQTIASQTSSVVFEGRTAYWSLALTLGTASSPSGNFLLNLPFLASMNVTHQSFDVNIYSGWNTSIASDHLNAYLSNPFTGQLEVGRIHNGSLTNDAVGFTATGCTITIRGITVF